VVLVLGDVGVVSDEAWLEEPGRTNLITTKAMTARITSPRMIGIKNLNGDFLGVVAGVGVSWGGGGGGSAGGMEEEGGVEVGKVVDGVGVETGLALS